MLSFHLACVLQVLSNFSKDEEKTSRDICRINVNDRKVCRRQVLAAVMALVS